jgi:Sulfotransferase family
MMKFDKWIFVTGAPRSGTSFVGSILSSPLMVDQIFEPTDPIVGMPGIDRRYIYLRPHSEDGKYASLLARIFDYDLAYRSPPPAPGDNWITRGRKRILGPRGAFHLRLAKLNPFHRCAVIKDPDGCLLTEYLHAKYRVRPVICVRHPTAFVASYVHHDFPWDLPELAGQPALIEDYFGGDASMFDVDPNDRVAGAAVLWLALNRVLLEQRARHPDWLVVVHEELCQAPVATFRRLFDQLGLPWSSRIERAIRQQTGAHNKAEATSWQDHHRDSAALFELRRAMLTRAEREKVLAITGDVALRIYPEESFGLTSGSQEPVTQPTAVVG